MSIQGLTRALTVRKKTKSNSDRASQQGTEKSDKSTQTEWDVKLPTFPATPVFSDAWVAKKVTVLRVHREKSAPWVRDDGKRAVEDEEGNVILEILTKSVTMSAFGTALLDKQKQLVCELSSHQLETRIPKKVVTRQDGERMFSLRISTERWKKTEWGIHFTVGDSDADYVLKGNIKAKNFIIRDPKLRIIAKVQSEEGSKWYNRVKDYHIFVAEGIDVAFVVSAVQSAIELVVEEKL